MAATTRRSPSKARSSSELLRFDWVERVAHWLTAIAFLILIFTGAALYIPALVGFVGRRVLVVRIHVDAGLALPLPLIISLAGSWGKGLRADLRRLNRWSSDDKEWMRRSVHWEPTDKLAIGKFNAGQKLNAAIVGGTMIVMLMTGSVMHWPYYFALSWRTGATFIHDIVALGLFRSGCRPYLHGAHPSSCLALHFHRQGQPSMGQAPRTRLARRDRRAVGQGI